MSAALLPLPIRPEILDAKIVAPALALLPRAMGSPEARVMLIAISLQESRLDARCQLLNGGGRGPARGLWQFERGTMASKGGVWGVFLHPASRYWLSKLCDARNVEFDPSAIYENLEFDDVLAAGVARLLLFTDPLSLPRVSDEAGAWELYAKRTWRPGKPRPETWPANHRSGRRCVVGELDL